MDFKLKSDFKPTGDQPEAIKSIVDSINRNEKFSTLLGVTGSGKTFTMANIIQQVKKPTLIMAHNKTLAAQLYSEFKEFFPDNAVEYFVSYYDYYQPEAYVAHSDTYIEKDASINDEIDKLRHSATASILERRDTIIISSVSCIYGLGDPKDYKELMLSIRPGMQRDRDDVIKKLIEIQYERNDINFTRGTFRVRGDILEIFPASNDEKAIRIEFFGDEIDRITEIDYVTGKIVGTRNHVVIFPASHYVTTPERIENAIVQIEDELQQQIENFKENDRLLEAQRIEQRTKYDIEMLKEIGFCQGIENYSRHITGREEGERPYTLMDFFPDDYLIIVDEAHVTIPQVRGMYAGDRSRKTSLIENGFRLPSALDNRPLNFQEFEGNINQMLFVSATPGPYEIQHSETIAEQIIRPTGLLDPIIEVRPINNQIDNLVGEITKIIEKNERVLITTLTKKMSEDLTNYLKEIGIKVKYLHSDIVTLERTEIIRDLRLGKFDVLVGINLLREGLDIPEVSLIAILDADKEGFLRSETALIQTIGRAARNENGRVIMYADRITDSMQNAIDETKRRRAIQNLYNEEHNITPKTIQKSVRDSIEATKVAEEEVVYGITDTDDKEEIKDNIEKLKSEMMEAAQNLQFERAAELRDKVKQLEEKLEK
ncbi:MULTISPECIES: excinuclease ABC subunit UvrB [unclassified Clostridioides]|uniref:excinuclease ABC subunit UvrB n=1 Tax=unclassified Clostridioides TaxID=2635829 RepID=UPI001D103560|nr:excinuclease ABC subunit UvrB [Clostridioides sp. ZZV15-6388]MCC0646235.1 excinuclease ABC subunit UvrB [Clostridioides sp. ZZV14-6150]MCC0660725.1 excinuclease ABC subunit UvrB [Clostridioides sp. ZZV14-6154]MCC0665166.1 excinuclease ABC subunit UvrB [Clostridioides sp. ZZV15-6597]MCC0669791.1 excinuclease ABC subunit UvrB [Clostridioides sp. ZZV14-6153]MCC0720073.1 excinuclease ABC subunit UvrB [Clostridioides sp. ZZV14-6105]MCC0724196.1 excinuclease ABC subunit UvrB [Clostridioides sp. 